MDWDACREILATCLGIGEDALAWAAAERWDAGVMAEKAEKKSRRVTATRLGSMSSFSSLS